MSTTIRRHRQRVAAPTGAALVAVLAVLVALLAGRPGRDAAEGLSGPVSSASTSSASPLAARDGAVVVIELVVGDRIATATLDDTPAAPLDDPERSRSYAAGDLAYWSPSGTIAVVYDALGRSVPPPGLVRLGTVQTGLEAIASAGNEFTMTIRRGP